MSEAKLTTNAGTCSGVRRPSFVQQQRYSICAFFLCLATFLRFFRFVCLLFLRRLILRFRRLVRFLRLRLATEAGLRFMRLVVAVTSVLLAGSRTDVPSDPVFGSVRSRSDRSESVSSSIGRGAVVSNC